MVASSSTELPLHAERVPRAAATRLSAQFGRFRSLSMVGLEVLSAKAPSEASRCRIRGKSGRGRQMKVVKKVLTVLSVLWASFGVWLSFLAVLAFARGQLPTTPEAVQSTLILLFIHFGIPCIALFLLLREQKEPWDMPRRNP